MTDIDPRDGRFSDATGNLTPRDGRAGYLVGWRLEGKEGRGSIPVRRDGRQTKVDLWGKER